MIIEVLGSGCANCKKLEENVRKACSDLSLKNAEIVKVTDFAKIAEYGVMRTPALVIDGVVRIYGRVPNVDEIKTLLKA